jgi:hypothetical protein
MISLYDEFVRALENVGFDAENLNEMSFMQIKDMVITLDSLVQLNRDELENITHNSIHDESESEEVLSDFRDEILERIANVWTELRRLDNDKRDRKGG